MAKLKLIQEVVVEGNDLVFVLRNPATDKVLGRKRWRDGARFVYATKEFTDRGHVHVLAVPVSANLEIDENDLADLVL